MPTVTTTEYAVRRPDGTIEGPISSASAAEGYMTPSEYAYRRAAVVKGRVVSRTRTVTVGEWK